MFSNIYTLMNSQLVDLLIPMGGLFITHNIRRVGDYVYQKYKGNEVINVNIHFSFMDGAFYTCGLILVSKFYPSISIGDSIVNTLAIYGLLSMIQNDLDEDNKE